MDLSGTIINGKYKLLKRIGEGGMGEVYEAENLTVGRIVAVKLLRPSAVDKPTVRERFQREARAAACIQHNNICEVTDYGEDENGNPFLVMPLLCGQSLTEVIKTESPMPAERACDITRQLLEGLSAAHSKGVVHRDLKPANIFLTQISTQVAGLIDVIKILDFGIAKILDFGISKITGPQDSKDPLTVYGTLMGTLPFMSPEQIYEQADLDGRSDLYTVGIIFYLLLTKHMPSPSSEGAIRTPKSKITPPLKYRPDLHPDFERVVFKAMAWDRDERYLSAEEMSTAIREALEAHRCASDEAEISHSLEATNAPSSPSGEMPVAVPPLNPPTIEVVESDLVEVDTPTTPQPPDNLEEILGYSTTPQPSPSHLYNIPSPMKTQRWKKAAPIALLAIIAVIVVFAALEWSGMFGNSNSSGQDDSSASAGRTKIVPSAGEGSAEYTGQPQKTAAKQPAPDAAVNHPTTHAASIVQPDEPSEPVENSSSGVRRSPSHPSKSPTKTVELEPTPPVFSVPAGKIGQFGNSSLPVKELGGLGRPINRGDAGSSGVTGSGSEVPVTTFGGGR